MDREILFRGRESNGTWHSGSLIIDYYGNYNIWTPYADPNPNPTSDGKIYGNLALVGKDTVDQYTGKKDRNGVLIFESDLVRFLGTRKFVAMVAFQYSKWILLNNHISPPYRAALSDHMCNILEIVGNIHDNPEMVMK